MTFKETSTHVSKPASKPRQKAQPFGLSMCREVRQAHFKSLFYLIALGVTVLGLIAWLGQ